MSVPGEGCAAAPAMDRLESGDVLIVTKLDRLGRDAIDVSSTVKALAKMGVRVSLPRSWRRRPYHLGRDDDHERAQRLSHSSSGIC